MSQGARDARSSARRSPTWSPSTVYWDPAGDSGCDTLVPGDKGPLEVYRSFEDMRAARSTSPWVLRLTLDRAKVYRLGKATMAGFMHACLRRAARTASATLPTKTRASSCCACALTDAALKDIDEEDALAL